MKLDHFTRNQILDVQDDTILRCLIPGNFKVAESNLYMVCKNQKTNKMQTYLEKQKENCNFMSFRSKLCNITFHADEGSLQRKHLWGAKMEGMDIPFRWVHRKKNLKVVKTWRGCISWRMHLRNKQRCRKCLSWKLSNWRT